MTNERIQREAKRTRYGVLTVYSKVYNPLMFSVGDLISVKMTVSGGAPYYTVYNLSKDLSGGIWSFREQGFKWVEIPLSDKWIRLLT